MALSVVVPALLCTMGVFLIVSGWHTRAEERPVAGWVTTIGTVVGVHTEATKDGHVYGPIVAFTDGAGVSHRFTAPTSSDEPRLGDTATVAYDPADPSRAHDLSDSSTSWAAPFVTGIFIVSLGSGLLVLLSWLGVRTRRLRRSVAASA